MDMSLLWKRQNGNQGNITPVKPCTSSKICSLNWDLQIQKNVSLAQRGKYAFLDPKARFEIQY